MTCRNSFLLARFNVKNKTSWIELIISPDTKNVIAMLKWLSLECLILSSSGLVPVPEDIFFSFGYQQFTICGKSNYWFINIFDKNLIITTKFSFTKIIIINLFVLLISVCHKQNGSIHYVIAIHWIMHLFKRWSMICYIG